MCAASAPTRPICVMSTRMETCIGTIRTCAAISERWHRSKIEPVEVADNRVKINPLAGWTATQIDEAFRHRGLPRHPLFDDGFLSIGCEPCTRRVRDGEDARSGRWTGFGKTECGIHLPGEPAARSY
jgi:3'-phosphoadenosine 5'-phosphosulfate sulfotransferase (PAPS reductase)/FAD synthetase